jgi:enamine deaminase RidA (YjgF/YER057c/UK114 family)
VLKTTVYVATADRADLVAAWDVVRAAFGRHAAPSTLVGVTVLGYPDQLVEVEAVAVRDSWPDPGPPDDADVVPE